MYIRFLFIAFFSIVSVFGTAAHAAPGNDNFANALVLNVGAAYGVSNSGATKQPGEPMHANNAGGRSVWFKLPQASLSAAVMYRVNVINLSFDSTLAVYRGTNLNDLVLVGYNNDCSSTCGGASTVDFSPVQGFDYYIAVDSYNNGSSVGEGAFNIGVLDFTNNPSDAKGSAYNMGSGRSGSFSGSNTAASLEIGEPTLFTANGSARSVWYRWQAPDNYSVTFELNESPSNSPYEMASQMAVFETNTTGGGFNGLVKVGSNADINSYSGNRNKVTFLAKQGKHYYVAISNHVLPGNGGSYVTGTFQLSFAPHRMRYSSRQELYSERASITMFRPSEGNWYSLVNTDQNQASINHFGAPFTNPLAADFDGDDITDQAIATSVNGSRLFVIGNTLTNDVSWIQWGLLSDKISVGDFDFDGRADLVAIRDNGQNLVWWIRRSSDGSALVQTFGLSSDKPVIGDFDGDGATDIAVTRESEIGRVWHVLGSNGGGFNGYFTKVAGNIGQENVPADFDGDGITDPATFSLPSGNWTVLKSTTGQTETIDWGASSDVPQPADFDGDGRADLSVFRLSDNRWHIRMSGTQTYVVKDFGLTQDVPLASMSTITREY